MRPASMSLPVLAGCGGVEIVDVDPAPVGSFRVMTFNVVHGTRTPLPPPFRRNRGVKANLARIAALVRRVDAAVVALQEVDGTDSIDVIRELSHGTAYASTVRDGLGAARGLPLEHGAALLARWSLTGAKSQAFRTGLADDHGFVRAVAIPADLCGSEIEIVSVHLDLFSEARRRRQIEILANALGPRTSPRVLLGDMNCPWRGDGEGVGLLAKTLGLRPFQPEDPTPTYDWGGIRRRIDWILVSPDIEFVSSRVLPVRLSDHRPVVADLRLSRGHREGVTVHARRARGGAAAAPSRSGGRVVVVGAGSETAGHSRRTRGTSSP